MTIPRLVADCCAVIMIAIVGSGAVLADSRELYLQAEDYEKRAADADSDASMFRNEKADNSAVIESNSADISTKEAEAKEALGRGDGREYGKLKAEISELSRSSGDLMRKNMELDREASRSDNNASRYRQNADRTRANADRLAEQEKAWGKQQEPQVPQCKHLSCIPNCTHSHCCTCDD